MTKNPISMVLIFLLQGCALVMAQEPSKDLSHSSGEILVSDLDLGVVYTQTIQRVRVSIQNDSESAVTIDKVVPSVRSVSVDEKRSVKIPSHGRVEVPIEVQVGGRVGRFSIGYDVIASSSKLPVSKFVVRGFADWVVDPVSTTVDLGVFGKNMPARVSASPVLRSGAVLRMKEIETSGPILASQIDHDGKSLTVVAKKFDVWGLFEEVVLVQTDSELQPKVSFRVKGEVRGEVVPSTSIVSFGIVREGQAGEQIVRLNDESGNEIRLGKLVSSGTPVSTMIENCIPVDSGCKLLRLSIAGSKAGSAVEGRLDIELPDYHSKLSLITSGFIVGKDEVIGDLNQESKASAAAPAPISTMLKSAMAKPVEMDIPKGAGPLLSWSVTGDSGIYGFEIYRAEAPNGPFVRANQSFVRPISVDQRAGAVYRWRDQDVVSGKVYWYYVGIIYQDGRRQALTSAQKVTAK